MSLQLDCEETTSLFNVSHDGLKFIIVGDCGGQGDPPYTTKIQRNLAVGLNNISIQYDVNFIVALGDNFYDNGVKNIKDPRFKATFEDAFDKPGHVKTWYQIAGNHDHNGNVSAQVAYTNFSSRWQYPQMYYVISRYANSKLLVHIIMIDTVILCGNIASMAEEQTTGPKNVTAANEQWHWIEGRLNGSKAPYLLLAGHYPPRSKGHHGRTTKCFVQKMEQLMKKYKVTAFLAGHDHNLQHNRFFESPTDVYNYIGSGYGAKYHATQRGALDPRAKNLFFYPNNEKDAPPILQEKTKGGFVLASLTESSCRFTFYNGDSTVLYNFTLTPRNIS